MFKSDLLLVVDCRPDVFYTGAALVWDYAGLTITVPPGFATDLASIPHMLDWIPNFDRTGHSRRPGVLHDWLYNGERHRGKAFADVVLYFALLSEGMDEAGAVAIYQGVNLFGQHAWDTNGTKRLSSLFRSNDQYVDWLRTGPTLNPVTG